jgi:hypothetical protein
MPSPCLPAHSAIAFPMQYAGLVFILCLATVWLLGTSLQRVNALDQDEVQALSDILGLWPLLKIVPDHPWQDNTSLACQQPVFAGLTCSDDNAHLIGLYVSLLRFVSHALGINWDQAEYYSLLLLQ